MGFSGVSLADFEDFYETWRNRAGIVARLKYFGIISRLLLVRLMNGTHEEFYGRQPRHFGLPIQSYLAGATVYGSVNHDTAAKKGDGIAPSYIRVYGRSFPTWAMKTAYSQNLEYAFKDWFDSSTPGNDRGSVIAVLLLDIIREHDTVRLELWHRRKQHPTCAETIYLHKGVTGLSLLLNHVSLWCWAGDLPNIGVDDVFLHPKQDPSDQDILVTGDMAVRLETRKNDQVRSFLFFPFHLVLIKMDFRRRAMGYSYLGTNL